MRLSSSKWAGMEFGALADIDEASKFNSTNHSSLYIKIIAYILKLKLTPVDPPITAIW